MRSKRLAGAAALALAACTVLASAAPASAQWRWGWRGGYGWAPGVAAGVAAGVIGGTILAQASPYWGPGYYDYYPGYTYAPGYTYGGLYNYVAPGGDVAYCQARFRSYNPSTGMYLGYDGQYHPCP
jgi:hypothetical protein